MLWITSQTVVSAQTIVRVLWKKFKHFVGVNVDDLRRSHDNPLRTFLVGFHFEDLITVEKKH